MTRNWALWAVGNMAAMRKGIDRGLALEKSADFYFRTDSGNCGPAMHKRPGHRLKRPGAESGRIWAHWKC